MNFVRISILYRTSCCAKLLKFDPHEHRLQQEKTNATPSTAQKSWVSIVLVYKVQLIMMWKVTVHNDDSVHSSVTGRTLRHLQYIPWIMHAVCTFCGSRRVSHDDVIQWKYFPRYWPFVRGIHRSPVNSPHKGQWCGDLMFSLIYAWINSWVNNREAGDLRRHRAHYNVIVMFTHIPQGNSTGTGTQYQFRNLKDMDK